MNIKKLEEITKCYEVERIFEWREWAQKIPFLQFPKNWLVTITPPFAGAIIRFLVSTPTIEVLNVRAVSVYLDAYQALGFWPNDEPYWEIYPYKNDTSRYAMSDTKNLLKDIGKALKFLEKEGERNNAKKSIENA